LSWQNVSNISRAPKAVILKTLRRFALHNIKLVLTHLVWAFDMKLDEGAKDWEIGQKIFNGWFQPALPVLLKGRG
jgi:hypothetical protein